MENNSSKGKHVKSSSSSTSSYSSSSGGSVIADLFGPKNSSTSSSFSHSSSSSSSIFGSVFGPPPTARGRDSTSQAGNVRHGAPDNMGQNGQGEKGRSSYYQQETIDQPCYYSSSIYYGGQEVYSPTIPNTESQFKKNEQDDDPNSASRGNWWQGSLYY